MARGGDRTMLQLQPSGSRARSKRAGPEEILALRDGSGRRAAAGELRRKIVGDSGAGPGTDGDAQAAAGIVGEKGNALVEIDVPALDASHPLFAVDDRIR